MIWATLAAQLAKQGLPILAEQLKKNPSSAIREMGKALSVPATPARIEQAIVSDPAALDKLAEIEAAQFEATEKSIGAARDMVTVSPFFMRFTALLALMLLLIYAGSLYYLATSTAPTANDVAFREQLKVLEYLLIGAFSFFFGSSVGSKIKGPVGGQ